MNQQEMDVALAEEDLRLAKVELAYFSDIYGTSCNLANTGACTPEQLCRDRLEMERAKSAVKKAEIRLEAVKAPRTINK